MEMFKSLENGDVLFSDDLVCVDLESNMYTLQEFAKDCYLDDEIADLPLYSKINPYDAVNYIRWCKQKNIDFHLGTSIQKYFDILDGNNRRK